MRRKDKTHPGPLLYKALGDKNRTERGEQTKQQLFEYLL